MSAPRTLPKTNQQTKQTNLQYGQYSILSIHWSSPQAFVLCSVLHTTEWNRMQNRVGGTLWFDGQGTRAQCHKAESHQNKNDYHVWAFKRWRLMRGDRREEIMQCVHQFNEEVSTCEERLKQKGLYDAVKFIARLSAVKEEHESREYKAEPKAPAAEESALYARKGRIGLTACALKAAFRVAKSHRTVRAYEETMQVLTGVYAKHFEVDPPATHLDSQAGQVTHIY
jgi:hypothetical protein